MHLLLNDELFLIVGLLVSQDVRVQKIFVIECFRLPLEIRIFWIGVASVFTHQITYLDDLSELFVYLTTNHIYVITRRFSCSFLISPIVLKVKCYVYYTRSLDLAFT
jgi:hypothetical protein